MILCGDVEWAADLGRFLLWSAREFVKGRFGQGYLRRG